METLILKLFYFYFWEDLNVGTVPTFKMHNIGTVPLFKMHNVGTKVFYDSFLNSDFMGKMNDHSQNQFFDLSRLSIFFPIPLPLINQKGIECSDEKFLLQ